MTCSVNGCDKPTRSRGLCKAHYSRQWRHGSTAKIDRSRGTCSVAAGSPTRARTTMTPDLDPRVLWRAAMLSRQFDGRPQLELDEWVDLQDAWVADHLRRRLQAS